MSYDPTDAAKALIQTAAPERKAELEGMWESYSPSFGLAGDSGAFRLEAGPFALVLFTPRTIALAWLLAHEAWGALQVYGTTLKLLDVTRAQKCAFVRQHFSRVMSWPSDQRAAESSLAKIAQRVDTLNSGAPYSAFEWPSTVPKPSSTRPSQPMEAAPHDLGCLAVAALFLHEIAHVRDSQEGLAVSPHDDEFRCDAFARDFMTERAQEFAPDRRAHRNVLSKRAMGLSVALYVIIRLTRRQSSLSHPSAGERVRRMMTPLSLPNSDNAWCLLASLCLSELRFQDRVPERITSRNMRDLAFELAGNVSG